MTSIFNYPRSRHYTLLKKLYVLLHIYIHNNNKHIIALNSSTNIGQIYYCDIIETKTSHDIFCILFNDRVTFQKLFMVRIQEYEVTHNL